MRAAERSLKARKQAKAGGSASARQGIRLAFGQTQLGTFANPALNPLFATKGTLDMPLAWGAL